MGIWGVIGSTTEAVKRNVPDLTPLKNASRASFDYGSAACTRIDQAVRTNGFRDLTQRMPEKKTIGLYASIIAKHTADHVLQEGYKLIPGGVVASKIIANTLDDVRKESLKAEKLYVFYYQCGLRTIITTMCTVVFFAPILLVCNACTMCPGSASVLVIYICIILFVRGTFWSYFTVVHNA